MIIGDVVRSKCNEAFSELGHGIVIGLELIRPPRSTVTMHQDYECDVLNDAIVLWPEHGISWHMIALLEVMSESR